MRYKICRLIFCFAFIFFLANQFCLAKEAGAKPLKIGFITVGPVSDYGYNYSHNLGRLYLQSHLAGVETTIVEKIPENGEAERVMEKLIANGNRLLFSTSYGYLELAERVAKRHPNVIIMQPWRPSSLKNMGMYAAHEYEPFYALGIVAGRMTKKNNIGFVCAHPVPILLQCINSFTLGARSVNPKIKVRVVWTNSWSDPATEAEAARSLIESGSDVLGSILDSPLTVAQTAEKNNVMIIGAQADFQKLVPNNWLCGFRWNWDKTYYRLAKSVQDGTWKKEILWLGMKDGAVDLCSFGKKVPASVEKEATLAAAQIKTGKQAIFKGLLKDKEGHERLKDGETPDLKWLNEMNWFVPGVEGTLPKK